VQRDSRAPSFSSVFSVLLSFSSLRQTSQATRSVFSVSTCHIVPIYVCGNSVNAVSACRCIDLEVGCHYMLTSLHATSRIKGQTTTCSIKAANRWARSMRKSRTDLLVCPACPDQINTISPLKEMDLSDQKDHVSSGPLLVLFIDVTAYCRGVSNSRSFKHF